MRLPPDARSPGRARRMLQDALDDAGAGELVDTAVLLASELCENAVLHAGTEYEVQLTVTEQEVVVGVSDRGSGPLELHLAQPRRRYGRAASHGRGLLMIQRLATSWGTRHDADGTHRTWFCLARKSIGPVSSPRETRVPEAERVRSTAERARWLLHIPPALVDRLEPAELVTELVRRLRDVLDAASVVVELDEGDGRGARELARDGAESVQAGEDGDGEEDGPDGEDGRVSEVRLPTTAPLRGVLRVRHAPNGATTDPDEERDLTELIAHRVGMAVESQWLRGVDQRRRAWMTYLAEASELLGQSLDVDLTVAVVPQVVVPRLGLWCAVHLVDDAGRLRLAGLTHADENQIPELREALDTGVPGELRDRLGELLTHGLAPVRFAVPTDGVAVALTARGRTLGSLTVGRPATRAHTPEDVVLVADIARRAGLAIHNAQSTAAHVATSQALQQALLPRALPVAPGVDFAAAYLPASTGSDVGGDFYDVLTLDAGHWLVSTGDVCGKGARAAARTGLVRDVLRVLVRDGHPLHRAVDLLNEVMMEAADPLQYCTLAAALVARPPSGEWPGLGVDLMLAGHLQPVHVHAGGGAELVGSFGTAVGLVDRVHVECTRHRLAPGDALLLYTDGVTERRRGREQFGSERLLAAAAEAAGDTAAQLVASVRAAVERYSSDPRHDDIALLAVRATP
jgi:serine phosphatase RsbU (regulator of sigma subunit)/anti-sigma regulatory factor (Ser/Thr protein kinase)